VQTSDQPVERL